MEGQTNRGLGPHTGKVGEEWLALFRKRHGRSPRILHIGNIANNAYLNAKMLNDIGVECHVVCGPYHHIMGCPEWEDAPIGTEIDDPFLPTWTRAQLGGFKRPAWFVQGPWFLCWRYVEALSEGRKWRLRWIALLMEASVRLHRRRMSAGLARVEGGLAQVRGWLAKVRTRRVGDSMDRASSRPRSGRRLRNQAMAMLRAVYRLLRPFVEVVVVMMIDPRFWKSRGRMLSASEIAALHRRYREAFPEREDELQLEELTRWAEEASGFEAVADGYDAVVGYATDGWWALATGTRPYLAYEHGTIRNLPFLSNEDGRRCAMTYRLADATFVTNCDNVLAAERLELPSYRFVPHPVNESTVRETPSAKALGDRLRSELGARFVVFHPSRQHWEPRRHPDWEKGNDILIRGFARFVKEVEGDAAAVFVDWGRTVEESRRLLRELGVEKHVIWTAPLPNRMMIDYVQACDVVADQFYLGAFGSTTPKALLYETPAMLYLEEERHRWCFPELPPVVNARTPEDVYSGLLRLYRDPAAAAELGREGRRWYDRYHSNAVIRGVFLDTLAEVMPVGRGGSGS